jgi:hypothetical protein
MGYYSQHRVNNLRVSIHDLMHDVRMIWWINYDFNWVRWLDDFHEHKISNTGWVWNGDERERSGTEQNRRECSTFLNLHFLDQNWSKDLEFALAKLRGLCKYPANVQFTRSCLRTSLFNMRTKQGRKINAMRRAILQKRAQRCLNIKYGEVSLQYEFATLPPKTTTSLWNEMKGKTRKMQSD